ncbi:MAG TPA: metallophosphoesterase, partial [Acidimicrobiia bacterium]|nr:metallophosphoesterase [Acidimicrobiia bacterium]
IAPLLAAVAGQGSPAQATGQPAPDQVVFAAGDIARSAPNDAGTIATGQLLASELAQNPGSHVLMLGDGAYPSGAYTPDYTQYYGGTGWGPAAPATLPVLGNHDYGQNEAKGACTPGTTGCDTSGFRQYFSGTLDQLIAASSPDGNTEASGWWSTTLGAWHIIGLNWSCEKDSTGCGATGRQGTWLSKDLAANPTPCTVALWHGAPFFSANGSDIEAARGPSIDNKTDPYWKELQAAGADVVLAGHQHQYERFDHMSAVDPAGAPKGQGQVDPTGMREFVVGTGGGDPGVFEPSGTPGGAQPPAGGWPIANIQAVGSQFALAGNFGILKLVLHDGSYDWSFISAGAGNPNQNTVGSIGNSPDLPAGSATNVTARPIAPAGTVLDHGTDTCHNASRSGTTPTTGGGTTPTTSGGTTPTTTGGPGTGGAHRNGYWMAGADGRVYAFGDSRSFGDAPPSPGAATVDVKAMPSGNGYWVVDSAGEVTARGDAAFHGQPGPGALRAGERVTSLSPTATGAGYWVFTSLGRALPFGDAVSYGDMSGTKLNGPVLGSIPTPSGKGYYMVASDGGIFAFGDAVFQGSMGGQRLNAPVEGLVPAGPGRGYWLVASDGGIFAFGGAPFKGSMGGTRLNKPVVGMVPFADGYLMVGADGGIFDFSSAPFLGSLGATPPAHPIVAVAPLSS